MAADGARSPPPDPPAAADAADDDNAANAANAPSSLSRNVPLTLLYKSLDGAASGIWASGATSAYILLLFTGTSASATIAIGAAQALQGVALAACALPMAWAADAFGRARVARFAGALAVVAAVLTSAAVLWPAWLEEGDNFSSASSTKPAPSAADARSFRLLCGALGVWGAAAGVGPTVDALFADSLPTGGRASWFQLAYASGLASRAIGPLVAALVFWRSGDQWRLPALRRVIVAGQAAALLPAAALFFLSDGAALGEESEGRLGRRLSSEPAAAAAAALGGAARGRGAGAGAGAGAGGSAALTEPLLVVVVEEGEGGDGEEIVEEEEVEEQANARLNGAAGGGSDRDCSGEENDDGGDDDETATKPRGGGGGDRPLPLLPGPPSCRNKPLLRQRHVPLILAATDLIGGLASGMTVKYVSVFFIVEVGLPPTAVQLFSALSPLLIALASAAAARAARRAGRVQAMLAFKLPGVALLLWLALDRAMWARPWVVAAVFLARTAVMNACYPLSRSILSDYAPKARRARWLALEAVTAMGWSGSSALGGWVIERRGFGAAFAATAVLQALALAGQALLLPLVPRREGGVVVAASAAAAARRVSLAAAAP